MARRRSLVDILLNLKQRELAAAILILGTLPVFIPIFLPMNIDKITIDFYNEVNALKPGDVVAIAETGIGYLAMKDAYRAYLSQIGKRQAKVLFYSFASAGPREWLYMMQYVNMEANFGWKYGRDYVIFPYTPGEETGMALIAGDLGATRVDIYDTPVEKIPLMQSLKNGPHSDLKAVVLASHHAGHWTTADMWLRQWPVAKGVRALDTRIFETIAPYYGTYIFGCLDGARGYAQYELLVGVLGQDLMRLTCNNLTGTFMVALIAVMNILYFTGKRTGREAVRAKGVVGGAR